MMQSVTNFLLSVTIFSTMNASVTAIGESSFDCTIHQIASMPAKGEPQMPHQTVCKMEGKIENYVSLDGDINAFFLKSPFGQFEVGWTELSIPTSLIGDDNRLDLDDYRSSDLIVITGRRLREDLSRKVIHRVGTWKVLAVRVIDSTGDTPTRSRSQLASDIFDDAFNLVSMCVI